MGKGEEIFTKAAKEWLSENMNLVDDKELEEEMLKYDSRNIHIMASRYLLDKLDYLLWEEANKKLNNKLIWGK